MRKIVINGVLSAFCLYIISIVFPGITVNGFATALIAAIVLGLVNAVIKPVLSIISLPITFLTLGLFSLVINALMLMLTSALVPGFYVSGFFTAFFASIILTALNTLFIERHQ